MCVCVCMYIHQASPIYMASAREEWDSPQRTVQSRDVPSGRVRGERRETEMKASPWRDPFKGALQLRMNRRG